MTDYTQIAAADSPTFTNASAANTPTYDCDPTVDDPTYDCAHVGSPILQENGRAIFEEDGVTPLLQEDSV